MRKYQQLSKEIIQGLGGMDNVNSAVHCATRLRFDLKDPAAAKLDQLKEIDGVVGVNPTPTQLQVIIGSHVGEVFEEVIHQGVTNGDAEVKNHLLMEPAQRQTDQRRKPAFSIKSWIRSLAV